MTAAAGRPAVPARVDACGIAGDGALAASAPDGPVHACWSFTRTVIAICALRLVQRGRLDLHAAQPGHDFTLWHLMGHTSGLPDYATLPEYHAAVARGDPPWPVPDLWDRAMAQRRAFAPGGG